MNDALPQTAIVKLFGEALGTALPGDCQPGRTIQENSDDYSEVIDLIDHHGQREAFIERLRRTHPHDRAHDMDFDRQVWAVMTEGEAFGWAASVAKLPTPRFTDDDGCPDLRCEDTWVEVKKIHHGDEETRLRREVIQSVLDRVGAVIRTGRLTGLHPTVMKKLDDGLADARTKHQRQGCSGALVVYFEVKVDFGTSRDAARQSAQKWARSQKQVRIVVTGLSSDWRQPLIDTAQSV